MMLKMVFTVSDELLQALAQLPRFRGATKGTTKDVLSEEILHVVEDHFEHQLLLAKGHVDTPTRRW